MEELWNEKELDPGGYKFSGMKVNTKLYNKLLLDAAHRRRRLCPLDFSKNSNNNNDFEADELMEIQEEIYE